jgi:hypothetical protein
MRFARTALIVLGSVCVGLLIFWRISVELEDAASRSKPAGQVPAPHLMSFEAASSARCVISPLHWRSQNSPPRRESTSAMPPVSSNGWQTKGRSHGRDVVPSNPWTAPE